jgi:integrase
MTDTILSTDKQCHAAQLRDGRVTSYPAGDGLVLVLTPRADGTHTASWVLRLRLPGGEQRKLGLGAFPEVSIGDARLKAAEAKKVKADGKDPLAQKRAAIAQQKQAIDNRRTFDECVEEWFKSPARPKWKDEDYEASFRSELRTYVSPVIGSKLVGEIDHDDVRAVFEQPIECNEDGKKVHEPFWIARHSITNRCRGRIETIIDWATERKYRARGIENPFRSALHKETLKPAKKLGIKRRKFKSIDYKDLPAFVAILRAQEGDRFRALEFQILTAARPAEAREAVWSEIDGHATDAGERLWVVPRGRMKKDFEHQVPLSAAAVALLNSVERRKDDIVFHSPQIGHCKLGENSQDNMVRHVARIAIEQGLNIDPEITAHGFRSTFRKWAAQKTSFPREVVEEALAHQLGTESERSYSRPEDGENYVEARVKLMNAWADYCNGKTNVVRLRKTA